MLMCMHVRKNNAMMPLFHSRPDVSLENFGAFHAHGGINKKRKKSKQAVVPCKLSIMKTL